MEFGFVAALFLGLNGFGGCQNAKKDGLKF
jgi:hypothetical protein